jgi:hypothetical protein
MGRQRIPLAHLKLEEELDLSDALQSVYGIKNILS